MKRKNLADRVIALIEAARQKVASIANVAQVYTNYEIGRQIVEEEQCGKRRADYGKQIISDLSQKLTARFGRGWGTSNLEYMRRFYLVYSTVEISQNIFGKSGAAIPQTEFGESAMTLRKSDSADLASDCQIPKFTLGWSHYLLLMRIADPVERAFYEREAAERNWSFQQLERMYRTSTFERLQISAAFHVLLCDEREHEAGKRHYEGERQSDYRAYVCALYAVCHTLSRVLRRRLQFRFQAALMAVFLPFSEGCSAF